MNFRIQPKATTNPNDQLRYGLNERKTPDERKRKTPQKSVFLGDDDDSQDSTNDDGRRDVNRAIAAEQAALKERAEAAAYDFDEDYETFTSTEKQKEEVKKEPRQSRYIGNLLKTAKEREREKEVIFERKIAREQIAEESKEEYQGTEKFVTRAYKRKLEERKQWEEQEEEKRKREELEDVTKRGEDAMFGFYGKLRKNVAFGGDEAGQPDIHDSANVSKDEIDQNDADDRPTAERSMPKYRQREEEKEVLVQNHESSDHEPPKENKQELMRKTRAEKVAAARERYLLRMRERNRNQ